MMINLTNNIVGMGCEQLIGYFHAAAAYWEMFTAFPQRLSNVIGPKTIDLRPEFFFKFL